VTYGNQVAAITAAGWVHNKQGKGGSKILTINKMDKNTNQLEAKEDIYIYIHIMDANNCVPLVYADGFVGMWLSE